MTKFSQRMEFLQNNQEPNRFIVKQLGALWVPFLVVVVLVLFSCKKNNDFGLEVQPSQDLLSANQTDTTTLITYSSAGDSLKTDELSGPNLLGSYVDPSFGLLKTSIYTQIRLESSYDFRPSGASSLDDIVVDSVVLYLSMDGNYGNAGTQTFEVYQLDEDLFVDSSYYTNSSASYIPTDLIAVGQNNISVDPLVPGYVEGELVDEAILRIPLSISNFALPIMNESGTTTLDGNDGENEFLDWFKGLLITTNNPTQSINEGAIYYIDLLSDYSKITLFYRDTSGPAQDHDTIAFDFNLNANCARFHSSEIDYSSTIVDATISDSTLGDELFYVQPLGGCKGEIYFPFLDKLSDTSVIINKAELLLPFQFYLLDAYTPPTTLILSTKNNDGETIFLSDFFESDHGGTVDLVNSQYRFNITRHINEIVAGEKQNLPISIIPLGSGISANRAVLNGANTSKKDQPKLVLTYTNY
ncbi:MAG: hypothetical protein CMD01_00250 [Flavobacteriales bacterium]|nr:hypothetical protein [Flavobacteriales bacterium]